MGKVTAVKMDVVTKKSGHQMTGMAVSVCITPAAPSPIPIPYPTMGTVAEGITDPCLRTKIGGAIVMTVGSCMSKCHGNEPGTLKEVVSLNTAGPCFPALGAPIVIMELGMAGITGSIGQMNKSITVGASGSASGAGGGAGGGGGGGGGGSGPGGQGTQGPGGGGGDGGGSSDGAAPPEAPAPPEADGQASAGHPVDVVTGAVYTNPALDFRMPGCLSTSFKRYYTSSAVERDVGFGHGWSHDFDWTAQIRGSTLTMVTPGGRAIVTREPHDGEIIVLSHGTRLSKRAGNLVIEKGDGLYRILGPGSKRGDYLLAQVRDADGNSIELFWDAQDRLCGIVDSVGRAARLVREGRFARWEISARDETGHEHERRAATYEFDDNDDLVRVIDAGGAEVRFTYDDRHYLVAEQRPDGIVYRFVYADVDGTRRCVETWGELENGDVLRELGCYAPPETRGLYHARLHYGPGRTTTVIDAMGQRHVYRGNALGLVEHYTNPAGHTWQYRYDTNGKLRHVRDGAGRATSLMRNAAGDLIGVRTPDGGLWREHLDPTTGDIERIRPDGHRDAYRRERDKITEVRNAAGLTSKRKWGERGLLAELTTRHGTHRFTYDAHGNVTSITAPNGTATQCSFDVFGCPIRIQSPNGIEYALTYDSRLDLVRLSENGKRTTEWEISAAGHVVARRDAAGLTAFRYVADGLVEQVGPDGHTWRFGYDALLRLRWMENPAGERYQRDYDGSGHVCRETSFSGLTSEYERDGSGFVVQTRRSDGSWVRYERDGEGRPIKAEYSSGLVERFAYDAMGGLIQAENDAARVRFTRDELGRVVHEETEAGGFEFAVMRSFDSLGGVATRTYSSGWRVETERRTSDGNLTSVRAIVGDKQHGIRFEYDARGMESARRREGDAAPRTLLFERDAYGLPERIALCSPSAASDIERERRYRWSPVGPALEVSDSRAGSRRFELDPTGRVLSASGLGAQEKNRITPHGAAVPDDGKWQLGRDGRPVATASERLEWDARGRLAARHGPSDRESWTYTYDELDRLVEAKRADGMRRRYLYDPLGRMVAQIGEDGRSTWFGWDGENLVEEQPSSGPAVRRVFGDDGFSPLLEGHGEDDWRMAVTDAAGTPWLFLHPDGSSSDFELGPWGDLLRADPRPSTLRLAGQRADSETGLHYNRHRWYDPRLRLFLTPDPLGVMVSPHEVGFVPNTTIYIDPSGLTIIVQGAHDPGVNQSAANLQRWFPGATVIRHDELKPGSLAGEDHVIVLTHGAPGVLQWGDGLTNGQDLGQALKNAGLERKAAVDLYACNGATPAQGGGPSSAQQLANTTGNTVRGARSNNPEATYNDQSTPISDPRFADAGSAPPGVLAMNGSTGVGVHDGEFVTVQPERGPLGRAWDTITGRRRSESNLPPGLPPGPVPSP